MIKRKKAQIFVSAVLYLLITGVVMVLLLEAGVPVLERVRDKAVFDRERDQFLNLNQHIKDVASEGQGSRRVIPVQVEKGELEVKGNSLIWSMTTDAKIIEPRSFITFGDLSIVSDFDVAAEVHNGYYMLENSYITLNITRCEKANNCSEIGSIINSLSLKGGASSSGAFGFSLGNSTFNGTGSTTLLREGSLLESSTVIVGLDSIDYSLHFTLRSKEDFVVIEAVRD